jgi:hypothetical protein
MPRIDAYIASKIYFLIGSWGNIHKLFLLCNLRAGQKARVWHTAKFIFLAVPTTTTTTTTTTATTTTTTSSSSSIRSTTPPTTTIKLLVS